MKGKLKVSCIAVCSNINLNWNEEFQFLRIMPAVLEEHKPVLIEFEKNKTKNTKVPTSSEFRV